LNTQKQQVYLRFSLCLFELSVAILMALSGDVFWSVVITMFGMLFIIMFLDVWLEPEKWKQKQ